MNTDLIHPPVVAVCGYSGSGKTTLVERIITASKTRDLTVAAVKHDAHGLRLDREGKDSDRFFRAGADVYMHDSEQNARRLHGAVTSLHDLLVELGPAYDLVLVEGHKSTPLPNKVWLRSGVADDCPPEARPVALNLRRDEDRLHAVLELIEANLGSPPGRPVHPHTQSPGAVL